QKQASLARSVSGAALMESSRHICIDTALTSSFFQIPDTRPYVEPLCSSCGAALSGNRDQAIALD
ncbi:MAG: hypothetical protein AAGB28_17555, partial [Pseudomonadota bacterium]